MVRTRRTAQDRVPTHEIETRAAGSMARHGRPLHPQRNRRFGVTVSLNIPDQRDRRETSEPRAEDKLLQAAPSSLAPS